MRRSILGACVGALMLQAGFAHADSVSDFYKGATIRLVIGIAPGADYDANGRLVARFLGKHIPGNPTIVAENMPGASGRLAAGYIFNIAPKDGTVLGALDQNVALAQAMGESGIRYDAMKFGWIGSPVQPIDSIVVWYTTGVRSIDDARKTAVIIGATSTTSNSFILPTLANNLLGAKFTIVVGYEGGSAINLALERGEVQGRGSNPWGTWKTERPEWVKDGKLVPLVQMSMEKDPDLPNVPRFIDLAPDDNARHAAELTSATAGIGRPIVAPPGIPAERLAALRKAFDETMKDPDFIAAAALQHEEVRAVSGSQLDSNVALILNGPATALELLKAAMSGKAVACDTISDATACTKKAP